MKKDQIKIGGTYMAKVTDKVVPVRIDAENSHGGWDATNMATNKKVRIKSAQRLRGPAPEAANGGKRKQSPKTAVAEPAAPTDAAPRKRSGNSGLDAAATVLADAGEPLGAKQMVEQMLAKGLWSTGGKTPHATIYAAIIREIADKGDAARFRKVERGKFTLAK